MSTIKFIETFSILQLLKNDARFEYVSWKMYDFVHLHYLGSL